MINGHMQMIKGGGAALTREKIIGPSRKNSSASRMPRSRSKSWATSPLPVEVIPMARSAVAESWSNWAVVRIP
ncbi:ribose-5-phosphate isomerase A [Shigella flexneri]